VCFIAFYYIFSDVLLLFEFWTVCGFSQLFLYVSIVVEESKVDPQCI